jgi:hypothetical protein
MISLSDINQLPSNILFSYIWPPFTNNIWKRNFFVMHVNINACFFYSCLSPLMLWVRILIWERCTILCDKVCQWLATDLWFSRVLRFPPPIKLETYRTISKKKQLESRSAILHSRIWWNCKTHTGEWKSK